MLSLHVNTESGFRGGERQMFLLLDGLRARGHEAVLAAPPGSEAARAAAERSIERVEIRMRSEVDPFAARSLRRLIRGRPFALVHAHTGKGHGLAWLATWFLRVPLIAHRRVDFDLDRHRVFFTNRLKYKAAARIIAISAAVREVLEAGGVDPARIALVQSAVDARRFDAPPDPRLREELLAGAPGPLLGNAGALVDHKGHRFLLEAAVRAREAFPGLRIVLAGDGELRADLERRALDLGLRGAVRFLGRRDDVAAILKTLDLYVHPSHLEGLGTAILEAFAAGAPVVAAAAGGIVEAVEDGVNGLLARNRDPADLAEKILTALRDAPLRARLAAAGRRTVLERFSPDRMVEETIRVYEEVLGTRGGGGEIPDRKRAAL